MYSIVPQLNAQVRRLAAAVALILGSVSPAGAQLCATVSIDWSKPVASSKLDTGTVVAQHCLDDWFDETANASGRAIVARGCRYGCVALMGWGAGNPEPSPGVYDWAGLDKKMAILRRIGVTPVITLCAAPDWMKGGAPGETDWKKIETAPLPEHEADFARLCALVARRYPDVKYYQVWNEFKGLWNQPDNNWDMARYTDLYNAVYTALKAVNPRLMVGGPYLVVEGDGTDPSAWYGVRPISARDRRVLEYWLAHKAGADFIVLDRGLSSGHNPSHPAFAQLAAQTPLFGSVVDQVRAMPGAGDLPIWFAELYGAGDYEQAAVSMASELASLALHGASAAFEWQCQDTDPPGWSHALFTSTQASSARGGGKALPLASVLQTFHENFGPGAALYACTSSAPADIEVLASKKAVLLINKSASAYRVALGGAAIDMPRYSIRAVRPVAKR